MFAPRNEKPETPQEEAERLERNEAWARVYQLSAAVTGHKMALKQPNRKDREELEAALPALEKELAEAEAYLNSLLAKILM